MDDPNIIDDKIAAARERNNVVCSKLLDECARMVAVDQHFVGANFDLEKLAHTLRPARYQSSGRFNPDVPSGAPPDNGSYAYQLYSAIMFAVDARVELKLLELIASPLFHTALLRSASECDTSES